MRLGVVTLISFICALGQPLVADDIAFGFFKNYSKRKDIDKLQLFIPLSIANELKSATSHDIKNPLEVQQQLKEKKKVLKLVYPDEALKQVTKDLRVDAFVYGGYSVNRRKYLINAKIFLPKRNQVLSLQVEGSLGRSITNAVKTLRTHLFGFLEAEKKYISEKILAGTKICLVTNLNDHQLNTMAVTFMKKRLSDLRYELH